MRKQKTTINRGIYLWITLLLTVSCQNHTIFHSYQPVDPTGWHKNDTLVFSLPETLSDASYQYEIGIRHKDSYKYRDIWLTVNQDTIHLYLADSIGKWEGNGIGEMRQTVFPIQLNPCIEDSIKELHITHIMQDNPLKGINHIGMKIRKAP